MTLSNEHASSTILSAGDGTHSFVCDRKHYTTELHRQLRNTPSKPFYSILP